MHFLQPNDMEVTENIDTDKRSAGCANELKHMRVLKDQAFLPFIQHAAVVQSHRISGSGHRVDTRDVTGVMLIRFAEELVESFQLFLSLHLIGNVVLQP